MSNRFYYGMPSTQAFLAMNALDDDVQEKSATAATAAQAAASSAAQAANARDAALAAWQASTAPNEQLAALGKQFHSGGIVDVFLYDTSRDSDGGAWRKRCTQASWEQEALAPGEWLGLQINATGAVNAGGANGDYFQIPTGEFFQIVDADVKNSVQIYRGNKKEFPAVALIVAEVGRVVIYDATQPTLPMWMVVGQQSTSNGSGRHWFLTGDTVTSLAALNGKIMFGAYYTSIPDNSNGGLCVMDMAADTLYKYSATLVGSGKSAANVANRFNSALIWLYDSGPVIVHAKVNDVAAVVLADAPIDPTSGLPIPTVALATDGGISVLKHDGTVANITNGSNDLINRIGFGPNNTLWVGQSNNATWGCVSVGTIPTSSDSLNSWRTMQYYPTTTPATRGYLLNALVPARASGSGEGITLYRDNPGTPARGMVASITNACNSGWQVGDIRGAWLSDIVAETISGGGELVTNGTFNSDLNGWTKEPTATVNVVSGQVNATSGTLSNLIVNQVIATMPGKWYNATIQRISGSLGLYIGSASSGAGAADISGTDVFNSNADLSYFFQATSASTMISVMVPGSSDSASFDSVSVKLVDMNRSVKSNPLVVNGTLTKAPGAVGSQLVEYAGFGVGNYLEQPYSTNLDLGTGDFCVMGWTTADTGFILERGHNPTAGGDFSLYVDSNSGKLRFIYQNVVDVDSGVVLQRGVRYMLGYMRSGGKGYFIVNGQLFGNDAGATSNLTSPGALLRVGCNVSATSPYGGALALWRIGATAPSADQIAQIYQDELQLFQSGAQCTIDGAGTAVTALAYDDTADILQVGTSWGRSAFHGLRRVESAPTAVGAVTALSAAQGAHMTGGAGGARYQQPAIVLRDEVRSKDARGARTRDAVPFDFDSAAGMTDFTLPSGWSVSDVLVAGVRKRQGAANDYVVNFDGYRDTVRFATSPGAAWVQVIASRSTPG